VRRSLPIWSGMLLALELALALTATSNVEVGERHRGHRPPLRRFPLLEGEENASAIGRELTVTLAVCNVHDRDRGCKWMPVSSYGISLRSCIRPSCIAAAMRVPKRGDLLGRPRKRRGLYATSAISGTGKQERQSGAIE
jgi:hypothetical protein